MRRARDERGVILVLTTVMLVMFLAVAALALDLGNARQEQRHRQNIADAVALALAKDLPSTSNAATTASSILEANSPGAVFDASCDDPNPLPGYQPFANTDCVSFDAGDGVATRVRVMTPDAQVVTMFAGVIGVDSLTVRADAVAQITGGDGFGGIIPFALFSDTPPGEGCLKDDGGGVANPPCDGGITGKYGKLIGEVWTQGCPGNKSRILRENIASGIDHELVAHPSTPGPGIDHGADEKDLEPDGSCPGNPNEPPTNTLVAETGTTFNEGLEPGLLSVNDNDFLTRGPGRLHRGTLATETVLAGRPKWQDLDDTGLYELATNDDTRDVPDSCLRSAFDAVIAAETDASSPRRELRVTAQLRRCFEEYSTGLAHVVEDAGAGDYPFTVAIDPAGGFAAGCEGGDPTACDDAVFDVPSPTPGILRIQLSPRFAYAPQFVESAASVGGGATDLHIANFRAVYLHRLIGGNCGGICDLDWAPGADFSVTMRPGAGTANLRQMTAFVFADGMLGYDADGDIATTPRGTGGGELEPIIELIE